MQDPIADMLNRLVNAQAVKKETVEVPFSQIKYAIAKILEQKGFVKSVEFKGKRTKKLIDIVLLYPDGAPRIAGVKRISKPGQRVYAPTQRLRSIRSGLGIAIISTSKGLMTNKEARKEKVGGEVLCEIY
ncbi:MAG: 30S ribosomal protein S8 [Candidatus Wildermuthbacteria bacterium RIFCSPLOWO2_01_FULL_48_29]|uniref:Small ribosomal subunit protein uS8 n=2 Tax=Candidatus Wildermuthiibacteriota TaxID=1817923 RepID=A0A1G2RMV0_9BACT|nr:MAG: 30S ribosomal protein S8 [Candidatus Wildermuthbacteria bacterium RIFCSPHIGHO2_01_FULL_48_27b]OHA74170.1 MAG: 30S ribosomal protein S8 [Candidatus Wildermuthbacteria bacterium RIFCSPLOWO2_01_FULL_48_29]